MKILLTGASGYIGSNLLPLLLEKSHEVFLLMRKVKKDKDFGENVHIIEGDLLDLGSLQKIPKDIDAAYYLVHSMSQRQKDFELLDEKAAKNFVKYISTTHCKQVIFLSGIKGKGLLSKHLRSRYSVEKVLQTSKCNVTILRAAIIIGKGSASFEIMKDLVRKLPIMIAPRWVKSKCQPIATEDVLFYLLGCLGNEKCFNRVFDIGGPDISTYKDFMLRLAKYLHLKRWIIEVPVLTPKLSSYWLFFVTSANFFLACSLVGSLKNDVVCSHHFINEILPRKCLSFEQSLEKAFRE